MMSQFVKYTDFCGQTWEGETIIQFLLLVCLHVLQASKHSFLVSSQEMCVMHGDEEKYLGFH